MSSVPPIASAIEQNDPKPATTSTSSIPTPIDVRVAVTGQPFKATRIGDTDSSVDVFEDIRKLEDLVKSQSDVYAKGLVLYQITTEPNFADYFEKNRDLFLALIDGYIDEVKIHKTLSWLPELYTELRDEEVDKKFESLFKTLIQDNPNLVKDCINRFKVSRPSVEEIILFYTLVLPLASNRDDISGVRKFLLKSLISKPLDPQLLEPFLPNFSSIVLDVVEPLLHFKALEVLNPETLTIHLVGRLDFTETIRLPNLNKLTCDVGFFAKNVMEMPNLTTVDILYNGLDCSITDSLDLGVFEGSPIEELSIADSNIKFDLSKLKSLTKLKKLTLHSSDDTCLSFLPSGVDLDLEIENLSNDQLRALLNLPLTSLKLNVSVQDLDEEAIGLLASSPNLKSLSAKVNHSNLTNLNLLRELTFFEKLTLDSDQRFKTDCLPRGLKHLDLTLFNASNAQLEELANFPLETLVLKIVSPRLNDEAVRILAECDSLRTISAEFNNARLASEMLRDKW